MRDTEHLVGTKQPAERVFSPELQAELLEHAGRWVACTYDQLLVVGDSPKAVTDEAKALGHKDLILHLVPAPGTHFCAVEGGISGH